MNHKLKITKQTIATIDKYRPLKGKAFIRDASLKGFGVIVSFGRAVYFVESRISGINKTRRCTVGRVDLMSLDEARLKAREMLLSFASGVDDRVEESGSERAVPILAQALNLYLQKRPLTLNSQRQYKNNITVNLQSLMQKPIDSISETLIIREYERIKRRAPVVAHKVMAMLHGVLSFASAHPDCR